MKKQLTVLFYKREPVSQFTEEDKVKDLIKNWSEKGVTLMTATLPFPMSYEPSEIRYIIELDLESWSTDVHLTGFGKDAKLKEPATMQPEVELKKEKFTPHERENEEEILKAPAEQNPNAEREKLNEHTKMFHEYLSKPANRHKAPLIRLPSPFSFSYKLDGLEVSYTGESIEQIKKLISEMGVDSYDKLEAKMLKYFSPEENYPLSKDEFTEYIKDFFKYLKEKKIMYMQQKLF